MFTVDPSFTYLAVSGDRVLALAQSINASSVKVPGMPVEPATAYIVAWSAPGGGASAVIYLHYAASGTAAAYTYAPRTFPATELAGVLDEAREFLESMGFMLDDLAFRSQSPERQAALMARAPVFHADLTAFAKARELDVSSEAAFVSDTEIEAVTEESTEPAPRAQAVGRLLASL